MRRPWMPNEGFILICGAKLAAGCSKTLGYIIGHTFSQRKKKIEKRNLKTSKVYKLKRAKTF